MPCNIFIFCPIYFKLFCSLSAGRPPFGQMPFLEFEDGRIISQSGAVARFACGLAGNNLLSPPTPPPPLPFRPPSYFLPGTDRRTIAWPIGRAFMSCLQTLEKGFIVEQTRMTIWITGKIKGPPNSMKMSVLAGFNHMTKNQIHPTIHPSNN